MSAAGKALQFAGVAKQVRPVLSIDKAEARRRVFSLYRAWYRHIPQLVIDFHIPKSEKQCKEKLKEMFHKNKHVENIRKIDFLIVKGQMELEEVVKLWKQNCGLMVYWNDEVVEPKPQDFLSKFLDGKS